MGRTQVTTRDILNRSLLLEDISDNFLQGTDWNLTDGNEDATLTGLKDGSGKSDVSTINNVKVHFDNLAFQNSVINMTTTDPSTLTPNEGDRYIVASGATGDWNGHDNEIAEYRYGSWVFIVPQEGYQFYDLDTNKFYVWNGSGWDDLSSYVGASYNFTNGLTEDTSTNPHNVKLGGTLNETTTIQVGSNQFNIYTDDTQIRTYPGLVYLDARNSTTGTLHYVINVRGTELSFGLKNNLGSDDYFIIQDGQPFTIDTEKSGLGMQYADDYSSNNSSNPRWIPDKAYVDSVAGNGGQYTFTNALSVDTSTDPDTVKWGGDLTENTTITADGYLLQIITGSNEGSEFVFKTSDSNKYSRFGSYSNIVSGSVFDTSNFSHHAYLEFEPHNVTGPRIKIGAVNDSDSSQFYEMRFENYNGNSITIIDNLNSKGMRYAADYSSNNSSDDRWIPDKGYIDNQLNDKIPDAGNGLTKDTSATPNIIKLGGNLTEDTYINLLDKKITFYSSTIGASFGGTAFIRYTDSNNYSAEIDIQNGINGASVVMYSYTTSLANRFTLDGNDILIESYGSNKGMHYKDDYSSANTTNDRWIPDKAYVDSVAGNAGNYNFTNGLTEDTSTNPHNVKLGGTLSEDTNLNLDGYLLNFRSNSGDLIVQIGDVDNGNFSASVVDQTQTSYQYITVVDMYSAKIGMYDSPNLEGIEVDYTNGIIIKSDVKTQGMFYKADYSTNGSSSDRWIPDYGAVKNYVDNADIPLSRVNPIDVDKDWNQKEITNLKRITINYTGTNITDQLLEGTTRATIATDGTYYTRSATINSWKNVNSGITDSGYSVGLWINSMPNSTHMVHAGTLEKQTALTIQYGLYNNAHTGIINKTYGINISPYVQSGTITDLYGLYIANYVTGGTVTNYYPLYIPNMSTGRVYIGSRVEINNVLDLNSHNIINVLDPVNPQDAATKNYVDTQLSNSVPGNNTEIIFNDNGNFGSDSQFTWDKTNGTFRVDTQNIQFGVDTLTKQGDTELSLAEDSGNTFLHTFSNDMSDGWISSSDSTNGIKGLVYQVGANTGPVSGYTQGMHWFSKNANENFYITINDNIEYTFNNSQFSVHSKQIKDVADPTDNLDAVNLQYFNSHRLDAPGLDQQVIFNKSGNLDTDANFTYDYNNNTLKVGSIELNATNATVLGDYSLSIGSAGSGYNTLIKVAGNTISEFDEYTQFLYRTLDMTNNRIINLGDPVDSQDAVNLRYLDKFKDETHSYVQSTNLASGWYTVAVVQSDGSTGERAIARFGIREVSSGHHQNIIFYASHDYGRPNSNKIIVLTNTWYDGGNNPPIRYIRIKQNGTYDGAVLQIYIDSDSDGANSITFFKLGDNIQTDGWLLKDFVDDSTDPGNVGNYSSMSEIAKVDLWIDSNQALIFNAPLYIGDLTQQYKVLTENDISDTSDLIHGSGNATQIAFFDSNNSITSDSELYWDNSGKKLGIGTSPPYFELDVTGRIKASQNVRIGNARDINIGSGVGIELGGSTSSAILSTQDGNGRIQLKWNASYGTSETFLVGGENAARWEFDPQSPNDQIFSIEYADGSGANAGDSITWSDILKVGNTTFTYKGDDILTESNVNSYLDDRYVNITGDTMTGDLQIDDHSLILHNTSDNTFVNIEKNGDGIQIQSSNGYLRMGPMNSSWCHFYTDRQSFWFDSRLTAGTGEFAAYNGYDLKLQTDSSTTGAITRMTIKDNTGFVGINITKPDERLHVDGGYIKSSEGFIINRMSFTIPSSTNDYYRVAISSNRVGGRFRLRYTVSGQHGTIEFYAGIHYGDSSPHSLMIYNHNYYGTCAIERIRMSRKGEYDDVYLDILFNNVNSSDNMYVILEQLDIDYDGWKLEDPPIANPNVPVGYTSYAQYCVNRIFMANYAFISYDGNFYTPGTIKPGNTYLASSGASGISTTLRLQDGDNSNIVWELEFEDGILISANSSTKT